MTAYCTATVVRGVIQTDLIDEEIDTIIAESDAEINLRLGAQTAGNLVVEKLSKLMTAIQIKTRQPTSQTAGGFSETHDPIPVWQAEVDRILGLYTQGGSGSQGGGARGKVHFTAYQNIDEDSRYGEDIDET